MPSPRTKLYNILKPLTKQDILRLSRTMCEHGHPVLSHTACLEKTLGYQEKVGYLDIETSNFSASFGVVITWCIKEDGGEIYEGHLQTEDFENSEAGQYDKRIIQSCVDSMGQFDRLVVYWGKDRRFDIPFLRTRAVSMNVDFPLYQERVVSDAYDLVKNKFKFGRNSLAAACTQFGIESKETPISPQVWMDATLGRSTKAIQTILQHNKEDVISTEALWRKVHNYSSDARTSI